MHAHLHEYLLDSAQSRLDNSKMASKSSSPAKRAAKPPAVDLRESLGLSRKLFSRLVGYSERAVADWESGRRTSDSTRQRLTEIRRLQTALARVMRAEYVGQWLQEPNPAFDGLKPLEVVERGEIDRLWRMIHILESGQPG